jgi:Uma2 family endonuclease
VLAKVGDWLMAGTQLVWVVDPKRRQAQVYRADGSGVILGEDGVLDGEDVLPRFALPLTDIL